jgi:hypothetical protein
MRIHHGDRSELAVEHLKKALLGKSGRLYMLYQDENGVKGIVEFSILETNKIFQTRLMPTRVDDAQLWQMFGGGK